MNRIIMRISDFPRISFAEKIALKLVWLLFGRLLRVQNPARLNAHKDPVLYVFNHNSYLETILVYAALMICRRGRKVSFLTDWMFTHIPVIGRLVLQSQPVLVYNKRARFPLFRKPKKEYVESPMVRCLRLIRENRSIGLFPEGKANRDPRTLLRGRLGVGRLVAESGVPVIPIGIRYPGSVAGQRIPLLGKMRLVVGGPIDFSAKTQRQADYCRSLPHETGSTGKSRHFLAKLMTHEIMIRLSRLSGKKYPYKWPDMSGHRNQGGEHVKAYSRGTR